MKVEAFTRGKPQLWSECVDAGALDPSSDNRASEPSLRKLGASLHQAVPWRRWAWLWLSTLVLVLGLGRSSAIFSYLNAEYGRADQVSFDSRVGHAEAEINLRVFRFLEPVRGAQALLNALPSLTTAQWKAYVRTLDQRDTRFGMSSLSVVRTIHPARLASFIAEIQADGRPGFAVPWASEEALRARPHPAEPVHIVTYRTPESEVGGLPFGANLAEDPRRREALEKARDAGTAVMCRLSGPKSDHAEQTEFAVVAPFYEPTAPVRTVDERRDAIRGFVCLEFGAGALFDAIAAGLAGQLEFSVYDGDTASPERLVYATAREHAAKTPLEKWVTREIAGRSFTWGWRRGPELPSSSKTTATWARTSSSGIALLVAILVGGLLYSRRALKDAFARQDVELTYQKFALDQHAIVSSTDAAGRITYANENFCSSSGFTLPELLGKNHRFLKSGVHPPEFFKELHATINSGRVWRGQICNRRKNGQLQWFSATIVPFPGKNGRPEKFVAIRNDITALTEAEQQIRQAKLRLTSIFDALDEGVLFQEVGPKIVEANSSAERILGLTRAQLMAVEPLPSWWAMMDENEHPVDMEHRPTAIAFATGKSQHGTILGVKKVDGGLTWLSVNTEPVRDESGTIRSVVSSFFDITEDRRAKQQLREAAQRLRLAAEVAEIGVWDWAVGSSQLLADERVCAMYGLARPADGLLSAAEWQMSVLPEELPEQQRLVAGTVAAGGHGRRRFRIRRRSDGAIRYIESQEQVQTDAAGNAVRMIGVQRDITEQVDAQMALEQSEARMRLFVEHAPASVAMFDRQLCFLVVSHQWMTDFNLGDQQVIGRSYYDVLPDASGHWREIHERCLNGAVETSLAEEFQRADGSRQWIQWEVRPWNTREGAIGGIVIFTLDITNRRELEASLEKARDEAVAASRLKSEFLATMSHEIRTPMNGVIGMASLLLQTPMQARQRELTQTLVNSAERLLVIINDILDFSKIEAGRMRIEPEDFNLRDILEETATLMAAPAHRKGLHFTCDIPPEVATGFRGDSGRIQQIVTNLLGNAVKFTEGGDVWLSARLLGSTATHATIRIEVGDTGIGIPESARRTLFQPFVQADGSTTRRFGGTGLGLAICTQLVALMGGRMDFESREGKGSKFWVELPLPRIALPKLAQAGEIPAEARVLVVDGHPVNRLVLLRQLDSLHVTAEAAPTAEDALATLLRDADGPQPFSIVLFDSGVSATVNLELARLIRATPKVSKVCLIMLAPGNETIGPAEVSGLGLHAVLYKPVREAQLRRCLLRVYGRRLTPSPFPGPQLSGWSLKVLLAEDDETNQMVAQLILEGLGHTVTIAENGRKVLEHLGSGSFDVVLMDCQMPVMDGYEATRQIRGGLHSGVNRSIPVIALTAYAMPGDRQRAIEAGMDDYVSKPVSRETLHAAFTRCGLADQMRRTGATLAPLDATPMSVAFDPTQRTKLLLLRTATGETVWAKALGVFLKEMPSRLASLTAHADSRRSTELARIAHTIAGSAASIGGLGLRTAASSLEDAARANDWSRVPMLLTAVRTEWSRLVPNLTETIP